MFIKIIAIFYKYQNEVYFYSIEITKTGILFRFNTLTMETENNCKNCEVKHTDTHALTRLPTYSDTQTLPVVGCMKQHLSFRFRSITYGKLFNLSGDNTKQLV